MAQPQSKTGSPQPAAATATQTARTSGTAPNQSNAPKQAEAAAAVAAVNMNPNKVTLEQVEGMTSAEVIKAFGGKSNAIRGLASLGMKTGPISKKVGVIYQHARNVLNKPLKRDIKAEREAQKAQAPAGQQSSSTK